MDKEQTVVILSASVRDGRKSSRVALFFQELCIKRGWQTTIEDLKALDFPLFHERLKFQKDPSDQVLRFAKTIRECSAVIIITPEYNGGYPAALKNVTDLLYEEWKRKPLSIVTVSGGPFAGSQVITSLLFTLWKIGAWVVPAMFPVPRVEESFSEDGKPTDPHALERAGRFLDELELMMKARQAIA